MIIRFLTAYWNLTLFWLLFSLRFSICYSHCKVNKKDFVSSIMVWKCKRLLIRHYVLYRLIGNWFPIVIPVSFSWSFTISLLWRRKSTDRQTKLTVKRGRDPFDINTLNWLWLCACGYLNLLICGTCDRFPLLTVCLYLLCSFHTICVKFQDSLQTFNFYFAKLLISAFFIYFSMGKLRFANFFGIHQERRQNPTD